MVNTPDEKLSPTAAELVSVFGVMNAGQVEELMESPTVADGPADALPVEIDLPEPELKFSKAVSVGSGAQAAQAEYVEAQADRDGGYVQADAVSAEDVLDDEANGHVAVAAEAVDAEVPVATDIIGLADEVSTEEVTAEDAMGRAAITAEAEVDDAEEQSAADAVVRVDEVADEDVLDADAIERETIAVDVPEDDAEVSHVVNGLEQVDEDSTDEVLDDGTTGQVTIAAEAEFDDAGGVSVAADDPAQVDEASPDEVLDDRAIEQIAIPPEAEVDDAGDVSIAADELVQVDEAASEAVSDDDAIEQVTISAEMQDDDAVGVRGNENGAVAGSDADAVETSDALSVDEVPVSIGDVIATSADLEQREWEPAPEQLLRVEKLIMALREDGHLAASIDPLGLRPQRTDHVSPAKYGIDEATLDAEASWLARSEDETYMWLTGPTVRDSVDTLRGLYCGNVGYEFEHVHNVDERLWLQAQVESQSSVSLMSDDQRRNVLELLSKTEGFERYLHNTFPGKRWYSLEGLDALMVLIDQVVLQSAFEVQQIVIGMTHRGRLNVLAHILDQPYEDVLSGFLEGRFAHLSALESSGWMTDVKYHQGSRTGLDVNDDGTTDIVLRLLPNPSHLEMVTPAVLGAVRAIQDGSDGEGDPQLAAMPLMVHGDAAFAGQGIVSESLNLMNLRGYSVGGAVHVIANNQIGFTTEVNDAFSGHYASDVARGFEIPVVHVNADDIAACASVAKMAVSYRSRFRKDFVIDLVGYRRHGHNENDDPSITQPTIYKAVQSQPTVREKWSRQLIDDEIVTPDVANEMLAKTAARMEAVRSEIEASGEVKRHEVPAGLDLEEEGIRGTNYGNTAVDEETLREVNRHAVAFPDGFEVHPTVQRVYERRANAFEEGAPPIDWSHAELLSFGSLMREGIDIRLTGQDVARGTFSQRHAALFDANTSEPHVPLNGFNDAEFRIYNSPLSEAGPLGFEHGYSVQSKSSLVIWEAQFGDFVNNAQSVIDEIVVSANTKWGQSSSLVLLLPHGYEGQGPNHSHAHLGRFLELSARGNVRVAFPTTAAQYFHLLRTQAASLKNGDDRKPLVIMSPKSLLRHPLAASRVSEFTNGRFRPVRKFMLGAADASEVRRVVLCTGKVFVDVASHPAVSSVKGVGVIVFEELYPFPGDQLKEALASFPSARQNVWLQEEPKNRGAWDYVSPALASVVKERVHYIGRPRSPSPASGSNWLHRLQQDTLLKSALGLGNTEAGR